VPRLRAPFAPRASCRPLSSLSLPSPCGHPSSRRLRRSASSGPQCAIGFRGGTTRISLSLAGCPRVATSRRAPHRQTARACRRRYIAGVRLHILLALADGVQSRAPPVRTVPLVAFESGPMPLPELEASPSGSGALVVAASIRHCSPRALPLNRGPIRACEPGFDGTGGSSPVFDTAWMRRIRSSHGQVARRRALSYRLGHSITMCPNGSTHDGAWIRARAARGPSLATARTWRALPRAKRRAPSSPSRGVQGGVADQWPFQSCPRRFTNPRIAAGGHPPAPVLVPRDKVPRRLSGSTFLSGEPGISSSRPEHRGSGSYNNTAPCDGDPSSPSINRQPPVVWSSPPAWPRATMAILPLPSFGRGALVGHISVGATRRGCRRRVLQRGLLLSLWAPACRTTPRLLEGGFG